MTAEAGAPLEPDLRGILPDNRVIVGQRRYGELLADLTRDAALVRAIVGGLDRDGVGRLRALVAEPAPKQVLLIVAVYPGRCDGHAGGRIGP